MGFDAARSAGRMLAALKGEYAAGKRGEGSRPTPIWPAPSEQLEHVLGWLRRDRAEPDPAEAAEPEAVEAEAADVTAALRQVDWAGVQAATAQRSSDAAQAVRAMASQVDWAKVQPVAAQVSSALIAAVAAGRIPVGGRLGPIVAKAIVDQGGLATRVAADLQTEEAAPLPDFRGVIEATAREA